MSPSEQHDERQQPQQQDQSQLPATPPRPQQVRRSNSTVSTLSTNADGSLRAGCRPKCHRMWCAPHTLCEKIACGLLWAAATAVGILVFAVLVPRLLGPALERFAPFLRRHLTDLQIGSILFAALTLLPCTLLTSGVPFMWITGIMFPFGIAFAIVMAATAVGSSLQYWAARYLFHDRVQRLVERKRKHGMAVVLRAVEMAGPWKTVALLRLGPMPYTWLNYAMGISPAIRFPCYFLVTVTCEALPRGLQVFFGRALPTLADLLSGKPVANKGAAAYSVIVMVLGIALVIFTTIYCKRVLRRIQAEELEREAALEAAAAAESGEAGAGPDSEPGAQPPPAAPLGVQAKLAAAPAIGKAGGVSEPAVSAGEGSEGGDLQMVIVDGDAASTAGSRATPGAGSGSGGGSYASLASSGSFRLGVGEAPAPGDEPGGRLASSRSDASSVASRLGSMRALLSGRAGGAASSSSSS